MRTYKYKIQHQSNTIRLGNLIDDMHQVHEYFLNYQRQRYKDGLSYANYNAMSAHLTELKRTTHPHYNALPSQAIQMELRRIDAAYQRFFDWAKTRKGTKVGRPYIKPKHKFKSFTFPGKAGWEIENNRITLTFRKWNTPHQRWSFDKVAFTFFKHRDWIGNIRRITIKRDNCGVYYLCLTTDASDTKYLPQTGQSVGCDFGMKDAFLTLSTGEKIQSPQFLKQDISKLRSLNKSLSRKQKGSSNWWRAVRVLTRFYRDLQNRRTDWQWKLAHRLVSEFDTIAIEDLNIDAMKRLWGRKVSDLAFSAFVARLAHKCIKHNREFRTAGRWTATSKPCSECGYRNENLSLSDRVWTCQSCDTTHDRDVNAAMNILRLSVSSAPA
ncbi:MAG: RNA-guided endonuclease TnpB family protein [Candidatus Poribacteria bacterium]|nr:RNA-guided endonuclease TnpB family protein [Candidatus Poribacteria bacterium]